MGPAPTTPSPTTKRPSHHTPAAAIGATATATATGFGATATGSTAIGFGAAGTGFATAIGTPAPTTAIGFAPALGFTATATAIGFAAATGFGATATGSAATAIGFAAAAGFGTGSAPLTERTTAPSSGTDIPTRRGSTPKCPDRRDGKPTRFTHYSMATPGSTVGNPALTNGCPAINIAIVADGAVRAFA